MADQKPQGFEELFAQVRARGKHYAKWTPAIGRTGRQGYVRDQFFLTPDFRRLVPSAGGNTVYIEIASKR